jgi:penicillin-binding protein 1A
MSARLERQRRRRQRGGAGRVIIITISVLIAAGVIAGLSAVGYVVGIANSAPDLNSLKPQDPGRISSVYAADGKTKLGIIQNDVLRIPISSKEMPKSIRDATVAIEDERFYQHKGVDFEGVIRAALKNASSGKTLQGGSTLTMQLIRTLYTGNREKTFKRKVREAKLAEELENVHPGKTGKEWILTKYLNSVPFGTNGGQQAIGVQAAARAYFDKAASELTLGEAAMLAGLPQAPSAYNPFREPGAATARRNQVLNKMADLGYISDSSAVAAAAEPLDLHPSGYFQQRRESYFFDYVTDELIKAYGVKRVRSGGLRITTTIDLGLQKKARKAIADSLAFSGSPSSAIVSIDPKKGYIRAMASSQKYGASKFNLAADAKRQPGSSFKVMALVTAVSQGLNPATTSFQSAPLTLSDGTTITCYGGHCSGATKNLIAGTLSSDNGVYIRLALQLGPKKIAATAHKLGITSELQGYPSETLGGLQRCCSPLEMANAYATIVDGGWRNKPKAITKVQFPDGTVDDLSKPDRTKVFDEAAMYEVVKILAMNISKPGTGGRAKTGCPVGGKTGTTDQNSDAWFVGFSPRLATSVWVGFPQGRIPMGPLFHGANVDGGTFPAQIWGEYMKSAARGFCGDFKKPDKPFKTKVLRRRNTGPAPVAPSLSAEELAAQAKRAQEQAQADNSAVKPGAGAPQAPQAPQTGGKGYDPGAYNPDVYDNPPQQEVPPDTGAGEPQATPP